MKFIILYWIAYWNLSGVNTVILSYFNVSIFIFEIIYPSALDEIISLFRFVKLLERKHKRAGQKLKSNRMERQESEP